MDYFAPETLSHMSGRGIFALSGHVTEESVEEICQGITRYVDDASPLLDGGPTEVAVLISSEGGSADAALCFADFVSLFESVRIIGVAMGECESAAFLILQSCHVRMSLRHCQFLIHHIHTTMHTAYDGTEAAQTQAFVEEGRRMYQKIISMVCRRSGISRKTWRTLADEGERYSTKRTAEELLTLGLLDKIVDSYPVF